MLPSQPNLLNSAFKQENLERLYSRVEEFKKVFTNLQKFLLENYSNFYQFGKNLQKAASSLEEYLKNYISDEKNCYFMAKFISISFYNFGDDFTKIFNGLSQDMNIVLNEILEKNSQIKVNNLDVLTNAFNNYCSIENLYFITLNKYKKACKDAETSLQHYEDSQKEAKSIYNLSIMRRNIAKVKNCIQRVGKYERKLKDVIELLNSKRKAFSINVLETISAFKEVYKYFLSQFYETTKKNGDALSSFISMLTHIIHEKKVEFSQIKVLSCLPFPNEFGMNKKIVSNNTPQKLKENVNEDWPDFLKHPEEINDIHLLDYADWAQNYTEKVYEIAEHRRKIMKHLRIYLQDFTDSYSIFSKNVEKTLKNNYLYANWSVVGDEIFIILENLNHTLECFLKNMGGFGNFVFLKIGSLEGVLLENQKNLKISYTSVCKTIKDHAVLRNKWLKAQNYAYRVNKPKAISLFTSSKDTNLKEAQDVTRSSIVETANNIQSLIGDFSIEEKKKINLFKDTTEVILSQMEFCYNEILEFLRSKNENIYKNMDKLFAESAEKLFIRLINNDIKIQDLYKPNFQTIILQEKDNDVVFILEFDKENNPIYQKLIGIPEESQNNQNNNEISKQDENIKKDQVLENISENNNSVTPFSNANNQIEVFPDFKDRSESFNDRSMRASISRPPVINITPVDNFDIRKSKSNNDNQAEIQEKDDEVLMDSSSPFRKKSLDLSIYSASPDLDVKSELNSPITMKSNMKQFRGGVEAPEKDKSKFAKNTIIDPDAIINQQIEKSNFDLTASPKKKKSTYSFFNNKFGLSKDEVIDDLFSCALLDKMLIQGKIFISNKKVCFHSYFNRHTFLGETKMIIPKNVIIRVEKRMNAIIFDNSIAIITLKGEIFFTSFVFRDKAYISILKMIQPPEQKDLNSVLNDLQSKGNSNIDARLKNDEAVEDENKNENNLDVQVEEKIDSELQKKLDERSESIYSLVPKEDFYKDLKLSFTLSTRCKIDDVYRILFSNENYNYKGKTYKGFWEYLKVVKTGDTDYVMTEYDPPPPNFFLTGKNLETLPLDTKMSQRKMDCTHPVKKTGVPFMPKTCPLKEIHKVYWISNKEIQVINEVRTEKVPYADSFFITVLYHIKQNDQKVEIITRFQTTFVKKTMMQGTIEKTVINETTEATNQINYPAMDEFLKAIYKSPEYQEKYIPLNIRNEEKGKLNEVEENESKKIEENEFESLKKHNKDIENRLEILEGRIRLIALFLLIFGLVLMIKISQFILGYLFEF